jgi:hypothetical protein
MTAIAPLARGAVAGVVGTLAMDSVWYRRYRSGGGDSPFPKWEATGEIESWEKAPAPAQMAKKVIEGVSGSEVPVERAGALNNVMHWGYGIAWTAGYAAGLALTGRTPKLWHGPVFGATVWASDYVTLPLAGVYEPIWKYDAQTLWKDLSAHLVFGATAGTVLRGLTPGS